MQIGIRIAAVLWLLSLSAPALALDEVLRRGLTVAVEAVPGEIYFNGVAFEVERIVGQDLKLLEHRLLAQWHQDDSTAHITSLSNGSWQIHSRIWQGKAEVLQVRQPPNGELIWSRSDLRVPPIKVPEFAIDIPRACRPGPSVYGRTGSDHFLQLSVDCLGPANSVVAQLRGAAVKSGFTVRNGGGRHFTGQRGRVEISGTGIARDSQRGVRTTLVLLQRGNGELK